VTVENTGNVYSTHTQSHDIGHIDFFTTRKAQKCVAYFFFTGGNQGSTSNVTCIVTNHCNYLSMLSNNRWQKALMKNNLGSLLFTFRLHSTSNNDFMFVYVCETREALNIRIKITIKQPLKCNDYAKSSVIIPITSAGV